MGRGGVEGSKGDRRRRGSVGKGGGEGTEGGGG